MNYFLAKTDPETYSIDDLERDKKPPGTASPTPRQYAPSGK